MKRSSHRRPAAAPRRGISLWETAMSSFLVGLLLLAATTTLSSSVAMQTQAGERARGSHLASALIDEILEQSYMEPGKTSSPIGRESGESATCRANYDDVDDYNGWTDSPPQNKDCTTMPDLTGWTRQVAVAWVDPANLTQPAPGASSETGMKRITVSVWHNGKLILTRVTTKANAP